MNARDGDLRYGAFADFLAAGIGLNYPPGRRGDLLRGMGAAAREFGFDDVDRCIDWLMASPLSRPRVEILARHLSVGETYFFREPGVFAALAEHVLPELIRARRERGDGGKSLRIWSAGCCTGEEAYSVAILLARLLPDIADWRLSILGTDINPHFLQRAESATFQQWSFRGTPEWVRQGYFTSPRPNVFVLAPKIRALANFAWLNLADDLYPSVDTGTNAMDLILCRNVLMYFDGERIRGVVGRLRRALVDGGWLVVSPSETSQAVFADFATVGFANAILYRKDPRRRPAPPPQWSGLPSPAQAAPVSAARREPPAERRPPLPVVAPPPPPPPPTPFEIAVDAYRRGDYAQAEACLAGHADTAAAMLLLARILANQGRLGEARQWCERAVANDKLDPAGHYLLALICGELGAADDALAALKRALYLEPRFVLGHVALGNLAQRRGKAREAGKHFANALGLLEAYRPDDLLPESDGMTAGRLREMIRARGSAL